MTNLCRGAAFLSLSFTALLGAAPGATPQSYKLNGAIAPSVQGGAGFSRLSHDGRFVVYLADQEQPGVTELFAARADGSDRARKRSGTLAAGENVAPDFDMGLRGHALFLVEGRLYSALVEDDSQPVLLADGPVFPFQIAPDGKRVVFVTDADDDGTLELCSTSVAGGETPVVLGAAPTTYVQFSPDSAHVFYQPAEGGEVLHRVPITGGAPLLVAAGVELFALTPDGLSVVYTATDAGPRQLFRVPADASAPPVRLNGDLPPGGDVLSFGVSPDGVNVVYASDQDVDGVVNLYRVPIDGGAAPARLAGPYAEGEFGLGLGYFFTPDAERVVIHAKQGGMSAIELFSVPLDGSSEPVKLNPALAAGDVVLSFSHGLPVTADGQRVVYQARQDSATHVELYSVLVDGSAPPVKLNAPLPPGGDVPLSLNLIANVLLTPDGSTAVYRADQRVDNLTGLYRVPVDGSAPPVELAPNAFELFWIAAHDGRVVFQNFGEANSEMFSVPLDASQPPVRLSGPFPEGPPAWGVNEFELSPDGERVAYVGNEVTGRGLYSARTRGKAVERRPVLLSLLTGPVDTRFSPDGQRVVFVSDQRLVWTPELFSVPSDGSASPVRLSGDMVQGGSVSGSFEITSAGTGVIYLADQEIDGRFQLFRAPIDGSAPAVPISGDLVLVPVFQVNSTGERVAFLVDSDAGPRVLYSARTDGTGAPVELSGPIQPEGDVQPDIALSADGRWVAFRANASVASRFDLFAVPMDGSQSPLLLNDPLDLTGRVRQLRITPDSSRVVYLASQTVSSSRELFAVPIDRSATPVRVSGALSSGRDVESFQISPDSRRVVYLADARRSNVQELFSVPLDAPRPPTRVSGDPVTGGDVSTFQISPDGARVVYRADQRVDGVPELFSAPIHGQPASAICLSHTHAPVSFDFALSPDSLHAVFAAGLVGNEVLTVPLDGSKAPRPLLPTTPLDRGPFRVAGDSSGVALIADLEGRGVHELYWSFLRPEPDPSWSARPIRR